MGKETWFLLYKLSCRSCGSNCKVVKCNSFKICHNYARSNWTIAVFLNIIKRQMLNIRLWMLSAILQSTSVWQSRCPCKDRHLPSSVFSSMYAGHVIWETWPDGTSWKQANPSQVLGHELRSSWVTWYSVWPALLACLEQHL